MSELVAIQSGFAAALAAAGKPAAATPLFRGDPARNARRLAIYRGNAQANAVKALTAIYPVTLQIVDTEFFDALARTYAKDSPSSSGDLNEYGENFGEFLAGFEPAQELPYLPDVARMEWRVHSAHYAADHARLLPARLAAIAEDGYPALRLTLHPACALVQSPWPLARIWEIHQPGYDGQFDVDMNAAGPAYALVHRPELKACVTPLSPGEHAFLAGANAGRNLGESLEAAMTVEAQYMLGAAFTRWVAGRVIIGCESP